MDMPPKLSIVIPAYNEAASFRAGMLDSALDYLKSAPFTYQVLFVDDGSTDDTRELLTTLAKKDNRISVMSIPHGGKAAAVTAGILKASGEYILFTDFDQSTPLPQVDKFLAAHAKGADAVIGIRGHRTQNDTWVRKFRSGVFVTLVQLVALPGIQDTQCGFKSFRKDVAKKIFSNLLVSLPGGSITGGYMGAFDVEALFLARRLRAVIAQVPVTWIKYPSTRLNIWKEPLQMLVDTVKVRLYGILNKYHV
ncbi:MAG: glycosyltransferase [Patescibacteria group bacterium]